MQISISLAQFDLIPDGNAFDPNDVVTVTATSSELSQLTADKINRMKLLNVDVLSCTGLGFVWNVAQAKAFAATNMTFDNNDTVTLLDATEQLSSLTPGEIAALEAKGLTQIRTTASDHVQAYRADQIKALGTIHIGDESSADTLVAYDFTANLATLTVPELQKLTKIDARNPDPNATRADLALSLAQYAVLTPDKFSPDDDLVLLDTAENLQRLDANAIDALNAKGIKRIDATGDALTVSTLQLTELNAKNIALTATDVVTLADGRAILLEFLTAEMIGNLAANHIDVIDSDTHELVFAFDAAMALLEATSVRFATNASVVLLDTGEKLATLGVNPNRFAQLADKGFKAIDSVTDQLTLGIEQAGALSGTTLDLTEADTVVVSGSVEQFRFFDPAQIRALAAKHVDTFHSGNALTLTLAQFAELGGIALDAVGDVKVTASGQAFADLTPEQFQAFAAKGVDLIDADTNTLFLKLAQFNALGNVRFASDDVVTLRDDANVLGTVSIRALADKGVARIESTGDSWSLSVGQAFALLDSSITLSVDDSVILSDTTDNLKTVLDTQLRLLATRGVKVIDATGDSDIVLSVDQAKAVIETTITFSNDRVVLADTAAHLQTLSTTQIRQLDTRGVDVIDVTVDSTPSSSNTFVLSVDQAKALAATDIVLVNNDAVVVSGPGDALRTLSPDEIRKLGIKGVDMIDADNNVLNLTVDQAKALAGTAITLAAGDDVTLTVTIAELQTFTGRQISALLAKGVDHITLNNPNNDEIILTVAQFDALAGVNLGGDAAAITLRDTGAAIGALTAEKILQFREQGLDSVDVSNGILVVNGAQLNAFGTVDLGFGTRITLLDTSAWLADLTDAQIRSLDARGVTVLNALDDEWRLSVVQAKALAATELSLALADDMVLRGTGQDLATLTAAEITALGNKNLDRIDVSANTLTLNAGQAAALAGTNLTFSAGSAVLVSDNGAALAALRPDQIAALRDKGVDTLDALDDQLTLSLAQYGALGGLALTTADTLTLADTGASLAALTVAQIAALGAKGIDALDAVGDQLRLSLEQFNALGNVALTAGDTVTLTGDGTSLAALTPEQIGGLAAKRIDALDAVGDQLRLSLGQFNALGNVALTAGDTVTVTGTGASLAALTPEQIAALGTKNVDGFDATDNAISLSLAQFNALGGMTVAANDVVSVQGAAAAEVFTGKDTNEALLGAGGNDTLRGNAGNDTLEGGLGRDLLSGGTGSDVFVFRERPVAANVDTITDYSRADDTIQLDNKYMAGLGGPGRLNSAKFFAGKSAHDSSDRLIYDKGTGKLFYDPDGTGAAAQVLVAIISNKAVLNAAEFVII